MPAETAGRRDALIFLGLAAAALLADPARAGDPVGTLLARFARSTDLRETPGVSLAIRARDGRHWEAVAGYADPKLKKPMTPATRLMSGSTGKTFCAALAMQLVEEGLLSLDRPVAPLFAAEPWFARLPNANAVTLRMLLQHSEGWPQFLDDFDFQWTYLTDSLSGRSTAYPPRRMLSFIAGERPLNAPGRAHHYSDLGYHLVGLCIEKALGRPYYDALQARILGRLATRDIIPSNRRDLPGLAAGYARGDLVSALAKVNGRSLDDQGRLRRDPSLEYTGGGLALTPRALAEFHTALADGRLVSAASYRTMIESSLPTGPGSDVRYGLGLFISDRPKLGRYVSHSGYYPGYTTNAAYFLDHGFAVALQQNTDHGPDIYQPIKDIAAETISALASRP